MKYSLLLALSLFCNILLAQKKTHYISTMAGIPIVTKGYYHDYTIPLTFEYKFRKGRNGFSIGLQPEYRANSWQFEGDSTEFVAYCKGSTRWIPNSIVISPPCQYSYKTRYFYLNVPIFHTFLFINKKKVEGSIETGLILNYHFYYHEKSEYPKIDGRGNITDLAPFKSSYTSKRLTGDMVQGAIRGVFRYKISKNIALSSILEYQHGFYGFDFRSSGSKKLFLHLGTTFKI